MVATKIFKKCSPHGRLYLYLGQREFISADGVIDDIKGVAYVSEQSELQGKRCVWMINVHPVFAILESPDSTNFGAKSNRTI